MRQENAGLRDQVEDLQAQLLSRHVMEGQQLLMNNDLSDASLLNLTYDQVSSTCCMVLVNAVVTIMLIVSIFLYTAGWVTGSPSAL